MCSFECFQEQHLPAKDSFKSHLKPDEISDADYDFAHEVWQIFKCKTLKDYHDLYLKSDVLLLADVFNNFQKTCLAAYALDQAPYLSAPGLSWASMLTQTEIELE